MGFLPLFFFFLFSFPQPHYSTHLITSKIACASRDIDFTDVSISHGALPPTIFRDQNTVCCIFFWNLSQRFSIRSIGKFQPSPIHDCPTNLNCFNLLVDTNIENNFTYSLYNQCPEWFHDVSFSSRSHYFLEEKSWENS